MCTNQTITASIPSRCVALLTELVCFLILSRLKRKNQRPRPLLLEQVRHAFRLSSDSTPRLAIHFLVLTYLVSSAPVHASLSAADAAKISELTETVRTLKEDLDRLRGVKDDFDKLRKQMSILTSDLDEEASAQCDA